MAAQKAEVALDDANLKAEEAVNEEKHAAADDATKAAEEASLNELAQLDKECGLPPSN